MTTQRKKTWTRRVKWGLEELFELLDSKMTTFKAAYSSYSGHVIEISLPDYSRLVELNTCKTLELEIYTEFYFVGGWVDELGKDV